MVDIDHPIAVHWNPSLFLAIEEQLITKHKGCPLCGSRNIQIIQHEKLLKNSSNDDSRCDLITFICNNCGSINKLKFIHVVINNEESIIGDFIFVFKQLLHECSATLIPDYKEFLNKTTLIYDEVRSNKPRVIKDILGHVANEIQRVYSEIVKNKHVDDVRVNNRLKLLIAFIMSLPFEDYNYVLNTIPPHVREIIHRNSNG